MSVITIFLNEEKFLREAIESVFKQTYDNWELLLVDDGSTDKSSDIAKEYARLYPDKVFYLEHEGHKNKGMSASRNLGVVHSHGNLISYLDADDLWLPNKLEKQVEIIQQNPDVGLVLNPAYLWHQEDGRKEQQAIKLSPGLHAAGSWFDRMIENLDNAASTCGVLIRKEIINDAGGSEDAFRGWFEDLVLWLKIGMRTAIYYDPEVTSLYRIHGESSTVSASSQAILLHSIQLYNWLASYLTKPETSHLKSGYISSVNKLLLLSSIMRHCHETQQREIIAALSYILEPLMPELLKNPEWNYFTAVAFQYLQISYEEALQRYDFALKYGFDESGIPIQSSFGFGEFDAVANRGIVHAELGHFSEALADLKRAVELKPDHQYVKEKLQQLLSTRR